MSNIFQLLRFTDDTNYINSIAFFTRNTHRRYNLSPLAQSRGRIRAAQDFWFQALAVIIFAYIAMLKALRLITPDMTSTVLAETIPGSSCMSSRLFIRMEFIAET